MVAKSVEVDISVSGDAESRTKLDQISLKADELRKSFPTYELKINAAAASQKMAVFRAQLKGVADAAAKPMEVQLLSAKAAKTLDDIRLRADKLKATFPTMTAQIDDSAFKRTLAVMAAEAKVTGDLINKELSAGPSRSVGSKLLGLIPGVGGGGGSGIGGLVSGAGDAAGAGAKTGGGILSALPPQGIAAAVAAAIAAIPVIASLATVATGAGAGLAAFAAVGANAYGKLTSDIAALHTANENFSQSALNVDTAISASAANAAVYNKALAAMPPGLRSAAVLLGDQNARWQDLSKAQQNNVVALANNSAALKTLLPSQKTALTQLIAGKKAWDDMTPAQQAAATSMNTISTAWGKLTTAMEPSVMKVIAAVMDQVAKAIGPIGVLAKAAVPGIQQMVGLLGGGFITFLKGIAPLVGPSFGALNSILKSVFTAINTGLVPAMVAGLPQFVKMSVGVGKLTGDLILMVGAMFRASSWIIANGIPALHDIAVAFDYWRHNVANDVHQVSTIIDTLRVTWVTVGHALEATSNKTLAMFDDFRHRTAVVFNGIKGDTANIWNSIWNNTVTRVQNGIADTIRFFTSLPGKITGALGNAATVLYNWGSGILTGMLNGIKSVWQNVVSFFAGLPKAILKVMGFGSPPGWAIQAGKDIMAGLGIGINAHVQKAVGNAKAAAAAVTGALGSGGGPVSADAAAAQRYAQSRMGAYGWAANQMIPLMALWNQESGWNRFAYNASSGATGIPQALPYSKMPRAAWLPSQGGQASAGAQVDWGLGYIKSVYGSPAAAEQHEQAFNWYGSGLDAIFRRPTVIGVGERGPEHVTVTPGGGGQDQLIAEIRALRAAVNHVADVAAAIPAKTGQHVGGAINGAAADGRFRQRYH